MGAQTTAKTLTDEELDKVSGGVVGINPLLLLNSGGQGIYAASPEVHAPAAVGANPLYVDHTALAGNVAPVYTPTHDATSAPQATAPTHDTSIVLVDSSAALGGSLNIAAPITSTIHISGTATVSGTPVAPPEQNPVNVMILGTPTPTYTTVTATIDGLKSANGDSAHVGAHSPLENAFDLSLAKGSGFSS